MENTELNTHHTSYNSHLPHSPAPHQQRGDGQVLLFYKYVKIEDPLAIKEWQETICKDCNLTGKVRISTEGLNVTIGGTYEDTEKYIQHLHNHPLFSDVIIKSSPGGSSAFNSLKVSVVQEAIPLNVPLDVCTASEAATHLTPDEVHCLLSKSDNEDLVILDARNYYESRIGHFTGAVLPPIRKFSQFPKYLQENQQLFKDKTVLMYCTGGIRCERGSALLKSMNICNQVYQLEGGIHEYINKYPDGFFRGKNYVFDNRIALPANSTVLSRCNYCSRPHDQYEPCCSPSCYIVTLCCDDCKKMRGGLFYCCSLCAENNSNPPEEDETGVDISVHENRRQRKRGGGGKSIRPCYCTTERLKYNNVEEYYEHTSRLKSL